MQKLKDCADRLIYLLGEDGIDLGAYRVASALSDLFPTTAGDLDLLLLARRCQAKGYSGLVQEWLAEPSEVSMSLNKLVNLLGEDRLRALAGNLGVSSSVITIAMARLVPEIFYDKGRGRRYLANWAIFCNKPLIQRFFSRGYAA